MGTSKKYIEKRLKRFLTQKEKKKKSDKKRREKGAQWFKILSISVNFLEMMQKKVKT